MLTDGLGRRTLSAGTPIPPAAVPTAVFLPLGDPADAPLLGLVTSPGASPYHLTLLATETGPVDVAVTLPRGDGTVVRATATGVPLVAGGARARRPRPPAAGEPRPRARRRRGRRLRGDRAPRRRPDHAPPAGPGPPGGPGRRPEDRLERVAARGLRGAPLRPRGGRRLRRRRLALRDPEEPRGLGEAAALGPHRVRLARAARGQPREDDASPCRGSRTRGVPSGRLRRGAARLARRRPRRGRHRARPQRRRQPAAAGRRRVLPGGRGLASPAVPGRADPEAGLGHRGRRERRLRAALRAPEPLRGALRAARPRTRRTGR